MKIKNNIAISDSGFIFNPDTGESFTVNPIGVEILNQMKEGKTVDEISSHLETKYNTDKNTLEKDTEDFLGLLRNYSLLINE